MQWQCAVGSENTKRVLFEPRGRVAPDLKLGDLGGRKGQRGSLSKPHGLISHLARLTQARMAGKHLLQQPQSRKQCECFRTRLKLLEQRQASWRRPVLT